MTPPADDPKKDAVTSALDALRARAPAPPAAAADPAAAALAALRAKAAPAAPQTAGDPAAALRAALGGGAAAPQAPQPETDAASVLGAMKLSAEPRSPDPDRPDAAPAALRAARPRPADTPDETAAMLGGMRQSASATGGGRVSVAADVPEPEPDGSEAAADSLLDALLSGPGGDAIDDLMARRTDGPPTSDAASDLLDDLLGPAPGGDPLDDLLAAAPEPAPSADAASDLLDALLAPETATIAPADASGDPLADLLADAPTDAPAAPETDPLDDLLAGPAETDGAAADDPLAALEALLAPPAADPELDDLLAALDAPPEPVPGLEDLLEGIPATAPVLAAASVAYDPRAGFGRLTAAAPAPEALERRGFRIAVLGDFSGRAAGGMIDVGVTLARRRGIRLDIDTVEEVIDRFATTLVLPIGEEGEGIAVPLRGLDSLHPDELVRNVALFDELRGLRQRLGNPRTSAAAVAEMQGWQGRHVTHAFPSASRSAAQAVPADRPLSEFQRLIGGEVPRPAAPTAAPVEALIARIVGPYLRPGTAPEAAALIAEVDRAMSAAMRLVLHHPEFQAIEAAWRTIDFLARRIDGDAVEITLYDVSAQELAADLATGADLSKTGVFGLLNAPLAEAGDTGFSAVFGLYAFEETPPHAELLGRMGQIAAHVRAPFFAALSPKFLETPKPDRHPLVARAWDALAGEPAAEWLSLLAPRFLLRRPYGRRTEPIDAFDFEEFTLAEGLGGMLWGNPAALMAVLLAADWVKDGAKMVPGRRLTVNDLPYHVVTDPHGDQVALPCTERLVTLEKATDAIARGLIPVLAVKGRDEVRLGAVQSLAGRMVAGRWTAAAAAAPSGPSAGSSVERHPHDLPPPTFTLPAGYESAVEPPPEAAPAPAPSPTRAAAPAAATAAGLDDLDALLAGFGDAAAPINPESIDADLAALLEGL